MLNIFPDLEIKLSALSEMDYICHPEQSQRTQSDF